jgi:hypothetical protein
VIEHAHGAWVIEHVAELPLANEATAYLVVTTEVIVQDFDGDLLTIRGLGAINDRGPSGTKDLLQLVLPAERSPESISSGTAVQVHPSNVPVQLCRFDRKRKTDEISLA